MILYTLVCEDGHRFDSWFRNADAFDDQSNAGHLACPICKSDHVAKAVMAPAVLGKRGVAQGGEDAGQTKESRAKEGRVKESQLKDMALLDPESRDVRALLRKVRDTVLAEGHDVGREFATEARRIHDGAAPNRQIYGQASIGEARELVEEGILVLPLPNVADDLN